MKRILLASASALLLLSSCGPSKEDMQKKFVTTCMEDTKKGMGGMQSSPQMDAMLSEYCSCAAGKAVNQLSNDELNGIFKNRESEQSKAAMQKITPQLEECGQQLQSKVEASAGGMQPAPQR
jgi:hypothetical protein